MCSTVEHVHYGHPNVIILVVAYAFTLQDIVIGASQYVLSAELTPGRRRTHLTYIQLTALLEDIDGLLKIEMFAV